MNIYNSGISPATTPLIALKGVCVVLTGVQADLCHRVAGGFNGIVGCQIDSGVFFHSKQKCKGRESCVHDVDSHRAKTSEDFDLEGPVFCSVGVKSGSAPEPKQAFSSVV